MSLYERLTAIGFDLIKFDATVLFENDERSETEFKEFAALTLVSITRRQLISFWQFILTYFPISCLEMSLGARAMSRLYLIELSQTQVILTS